MKWWKITLIVAAILTTFFTYYQIDFVVSKITTIANINILDRTTEQQEFENPIFFNKPKLYQMSASHSKNKTLNILWINTPVWVNVSYLNEYLTHNCSYKNCRMTTNRQNISQKAAVIFSAQDQISQSRHISPTNRPKYQIWVFLRKEPPAIYKMKWYHNHVWRKTMNWSWGYRFDSDIFYPSAMFNIRKKPLNRNYSEIFRRKSRDAVWAVSRCPTQSRRGEYVKHLQDFGLSVDLFGKCSKDKRVVPESQLLSAINEKYKFYLSFESSFCKDYITEKFFMYYGLDTVLLARGGLNYSKYFDKSTFIDTADFASVREVAEYLKKVGNNETLYTQYLRAKDKYVPTPKSHEFGRSSCVLCQMLNSVHEYQKVYDDIESYIHFNTCFPPHDIH